MAKVPPSRYFDASVIIKYVMNDPETAETIHRLLIEAREGKWKVAITPLVMVEVTRERGKPVDLTRAAIIEQFFDNEFFFIREIDAELANTARRLIFDHIHLRPIDALHLAAAIDLDCDVLYSYDDDLLQMDGEYGLRVERPRDMEISELPLFRDLDS
jgi:predicted nucleic acid-binding protein